MKCPMYDSCTLRTGGCVASLPDNGCYWYRWFKDLIQKTENPWHTGAPTEEGWYLLYTSKPNASYHLAFYQFNHWFSTDEYCIIREDVVAWQKITPYEEN